MRLTLALLVLLLSGCAGSSKPPTFDTPPDVTPDGLQRFDSPVFELVYVKPDLDLSSYNLIQIRPIGLGYKRDPAKGPMLLRPARNFELNPSQRTQVSRAFARAFTEAMTGDQRYRQVIDPEAGAMQVKLALARLEVNIPEAGADTTEKVTVDKAGEMTLVVEVSDSISGEPLVRGRDTYVVSGDGQSRADLNLEISAVFTQWAIDIRNGFDQLSPGRN
ncbi:MAG: DUF3313 family protein [Pseudomonadota bacterium]